MRKIDISGKRFGRLTAINEDFNNKKQWICICDCGNTKSIHKSNLTSGQIKSCGCLNSELASKRFRKHGKRNERIYNIWCGMIARCTNKNEPAYKRYGAIGIKISPKWLTFEGFYEDMGSTYKDNLTLDRWPNKTGNYEFANCRWATQKQQQNNRTNNNNIIINGEEKTLAEWAEFVGLNYKTISTRIRRGWPINEAIFNKKNSNSNNDIIINNETGIFYETCKDAANSLNISRSHLYRKLNNITFNNTPFIYA